MPRNWLDSPCNGLRARGNASVKRRCHSRALIPPCEEHRGVQRITYLYVCGDFLNDSEGIAGCEAYRDDLGLMYFASMEPSSGLLMTATRIKNFWVNRTSREESLWLQNVLNREGEEFATWVELNEDNALTLQWAR